MDAELLARIQFGLTAGFHFLFPPLNIGLGVVLVIMEWRFLRTKNLMYERMAKFWTKIFALAFSIGVATGIVMEFEFGTNWATYSRYVGDIFGSPLAAEALFAFFLESTFLGLLIFGWNRIGPKMHFFSTICVAFGAMLSAFWIIAANSWMQTPAGYHIVGSGNTMRAEIIDFWAMVFNPSTIDRFTHVISASWLTGAFFVISIAAYYLLKRKHIDFAKSSMRIALGLATVAALFQLHTGHNSAMGVVKEQPAKLATYEGHFNKGVLDLYFIGWLDVENERIIGLRWPGFLSYLIYGNFSAEVKGRNDFPKEDLPPIQLPFQTYHIMVAIGMFFIGIVLIALFLLFRKKLFETQWFLKLLLPAFLLPHIANLCGWIAAEVGRQPWAVYGILRTKDAISKVVVAEQILFSIIMFSIIYLILGGLFIYLLMKKINHGPEEMEPTVA